MKRRWMIRSGVALIGACLLLPGCGGDQGGEETSRAAEEAAAKMAAEMQSFRDDIRMRLERLDHELGVLRESATQLQGEAAAEALQTIQDLDTRMGAIRQDLLKMRGAMEQRVAEGGEAVQAVSAEEWSDLKNTCLHAMDEAERKLTEAKASLLGSPSAEIGGEGRGEAH